MGREGEIYLITGGCGGLHQSSLLPHRRLPRRSYVEGTERVVLLGERERERKEKEKKEGEKKVDRFVRGSLARAALLLGAI